MKCDKVWREVACIANGTNRHMSIGSNSDGSDAAVP